MRAALEQEDPALHEGDEKVGGHEALRLLEHWESADGGRRVRRHQLRFVLPGSASPGGGVGLVGRQVEEVVSGIYVLDVEVELLPHLHRLRQLDDGEGVLLRRPAHGDEAPALARRLLGGGVELPIKECSP